MNLRGQYSFQVQIILKNGILPVHGRYCFAIDMYLKYYKKNTDTVVHDLKIHGKRTQLKKDTVLGAGTKFSTSKYLK